MTLSDSHTATSLQHAMEMNNRAADLMVTGQNSQGLLCFQATIKAMKEASSSCTADSSTSKAHSFQVPESAAQVMKPCDKALLQRTQTHVYVYDHQFLFKQTVCTNGDNEALLALYSGTMLFNFGLALHTDGLVSGSDSYLRKALYIYEMAFYLLSPNAKCESFAAVIAVILNNEANIYFSLGEFTKAERQFSNLADILHSMYLQLCQILSTAVVEELFLNTLVGHRPCASQAA